jgi:hypothetical protein
MPIMDYNGFRSWRKIRKGAPMDGMAVSVQNVARFKIKTTSGNWIPKHFKKHVRSVEEPEKTQDSRNISLKEFFLSNV